MSNSASSPSAALEVTLCTSVSISVSAVQLITPGSSRYVNFSASAIPTSASTPPGWYWKILVPFSPNANVILLGEPVWLMGSRLLHQQPVTHSREGSSSNLCSKFDLSQSRSSKDVNGKAFSIQSYYRVLILAVSGSSIGSRHTHQYVCCYQAFNLFFWPRGVYYCCPIHKQHELQCWRFWMVSQPLAPWQKETSFLPQNRHARWLFW